MKRYVKCNDESVITLAYSDNAKDRRKAASDPSTPPNILEALADDEDDDVIQRLAQNPNTPARVIRHIAAVGPRHVKAQLASFTDDQEILKKFAKDGDEAIRRLCATNPNIMLSALYQLSKDKSIDVCRLVFNNPKTPESFREEILKRFPYINDDPLDSLKYSESYSNNLNRWPSEDEWYNIDSDEQFDNMWSTYLASPEEEVNKELQIFPEPSTQGGVGGMFIFDESGNENESFSIDYQDWCNKEIEIAASSKSAIEYKEKYEQYVESLINEHWA